MMGGLLRLLILIFISTVSEGYNGDDSCSEPLVYRAKLSATSHLQGHAAQDATIESRSCWSPSVDNYYQSIFINLLRTVIVNRVGTKGCGNDFVREYAIHYSTDGMHWKLFGELFKGNHDGDRMSYNTFETPIIAQFIRINPTRWGERISLKVELYGCDYVSQIVSFNGSTVIFKNLTETRIQSIRDTIRFRFKTVMADGILMYSWGTKGDYFALQIVRNRLLLNINLGSGTMTSITAGSLLDDNIWHDVSIERLLNKVSFTVDRVEIQGTIKGDFQTLDLNRMLYIGAVPNIQEGLIIGKNFTGCMKNLYLNHTNVIYELKNPSYYEEERFYSNFTLYQCPSSNIVPVTFTNPKSYIKLTGYGFGTLNVSLEFRAFELQGTLLFHKFTSNGFVKVYLEKGKILVDLEIENSPRYTLDNYADLFNDGLWHHVELTVARNTVTLMVDGRLVRTTKLMEVIAGETYYIGGVEISFLLLNNLMHLNTPGFVGCIRQVSIDGNFTNPLVWKVDEHLCCDGSIVLDACQMLDRCSPNPCEHGGTCKQSSIEFECICDETGYSGGVCHTPFHPPSCQAYRNTHQTNQRVEITIDPDGSGPLAPFPVTCQYYIGGGTETFIRHSNEEETIVDGFQEAGSFSQDITYDGDFNQIETIVNRSSDCKQYIEYKCRQSRLFNTSYREDEPFRPNSWWLSRQNQSMDHWEDSLFGNRKCECGILNKCVMENVWCNCNAGLESEESDGCYLTEKEYLPVRQVRFGDTGSPLYEKQGKFKLGPLICEGDALYDNVVTFRQPDAALTFPPPDLSHSWDISFGFKTTTFKAVLVHAIGSADYIMVSIIDGNQIQFRAYQSSQVEACVASVRTSGRLNDDQWHTVSIERNRKQARIVIDGSQASPLVQSENKGRPIELSSDLFLGASVNYSDGYVGCMRAVTVNGVMLDLAEAVEREKYGVGMGCIAKCDSSPCLNNGSCIEGYNHYVCDCRYTAFKGPTCTDEIGINMKSNSMVRWDFIGSFKSTIAERLRVGFTTTEPNGFLVGIFSNITGEYLTLMVSNSGHLRLVFDFGFERQEIIFEKYNFAKGQYHDVLVTRMDSGTKLVIKVDNIEPQVFTFSVKARADPQFNNIQYLYLGKNESMREGFIGCISRVEFDNIFPLKILFQENRPKHVRSEPTDLAADFCGVEPVVHPADIIGGIRPAPDLDEEKVRKVFRNTYDLHHTKMDMDILLFQYILFDILISISCIVGWIGNTLCIIVLTHPDMRSPFSTLLIGLSISDSLFLCSQFLVVGPGRNILLDFFSKFEDTVIPLAYFSFFRTIAQAYTIYSTLGVSIERYIAIKYPLKAKLIFTRKTSIFITIFILFISIILSLGVLLILFKNPELTYIIYIYSTYFLTILLSFLPILILIVLNIMIYLNIRKQAKQRTTMTVTKKSEVSITKLLLCVVFVFAFCYISVSVYYIWDIIFGYQDFLKYIAIWSHFTQTLNSSVNFIIYIVIGKKFKETFIKMCKCTLVKLRLVRNTEQSPPPTLTA